MSAFQVSSLSLSAWREAEDQSERESLAKVWQEAFSSHGLLYLTDHGLADLYHRVCWDWLEFCECEQEHVIKRDIKLLASARRYFWYTS